MDQRDLCKVRDRSPALHSLLLELLDAEELEQYVDGIPDDGPVRADDDPSTTAARRQGRRQRRSRRPSA
jgi:hypothetical protein